MTPLKNALPWIALGAVAIIAACAQGSSATGENVAPITGDGGVQPLNSNDQDGGSVTPNDNDAGANENPGDDAGAPVADDDAGNPTTSDDAGQPSGSDDAGSGGVDAGGSATPDAGTHSGGIDAGSSSSVPTTCTQAYGKIGCCAGNTAYYCDSTTTPTAKACTGTKVCGWDSSGSYYDCVAAPGGADPSGTNPIACQ